MTASPREQLAALLRHAVANCYEGGPDEDILTRMNAVADFADVNCDWTWLADWLLGHGVTVAPPDQARREGPRPWPTLYAHPGVPIGEVWYASDEHLQKFRWAKDGEGVLTLIEYDRVGRADEEPR